MEPIKATISDPKQSGRNLSNDKELIAAWSFVVRDGAHLAEPIRVRWWMGRSTSATKVFCTIWVSGRGICCAGHGSAGGWGYDKQSAALQEAINRAGITLSTYIDGCGDMASAAACDAIVRALGFKGEILHIRHA